jgi:hypothetical protein
MTLPQKKIKHQVSSGQDWGRSLISASGKKASKTHLDNCLLEPVVRMGLPEPLRLALPEQPEPLRLVRGKVLELARARARGVGWQRKRYTLQLCQNFLCVETLMGFL